MSITPAHINDPTYPLTISSTPSDANNTMTVPSGTTVGGNTGSGADNIVFKNKGTVAVAVKGFLNGSNPVPFAAFPPRTTPLAIPTTMVTIFQGSIVEPGELVTVSRRIGTPRYDQFCFIAESGSGLIDMQFTNGI